MFVKVIHKIIMPNPDATAKVGAQVDVEPGTVIEVDDAMGYDLVKQGAASQVDGPEDNTVQTDFTNLPKRDVPQPGPQDPRYAPPTASSAPVQPKTQPPKGPRTAQELSNAAVAPPPTDAKATVVDTGKSDKKS